MLEWWSVEDICVELGITGRTFFRYTEPGYRERENQYLRKHRKRKKKEKLSEKIAELLKQGKSIGEICSELEIRHHTFFQHVDSSLVEELIGQDEKYSLRRDTKNNKNP